MYLGILFVIAFLLWLILDVLNDIRDTLNPDSEED